MPDHLTDEEPAVGARDGMVQHQQNADYWSAGEGR